MRSTILGMGALLGLATGCQSTHAVRYFSKQPEGGIIAVSQINPETHDKAIVLIEEHLGKNNYVIDKQEEIVLENGANKTAPGSPRGPGGTPPNTRIDKELRIYYHRKPNLNAMGDAGMGLRPAAGALPSVLPSGGVVPAGSAMPVGASSPNTMTPSNRMSTSFVPTECPNCKP